MVLPQMSAQRIAIATSLVCILAGLPILFTLPFCRLNLPLQSECVALPPVGAAVDLGKTDSALGLKQENGNQSTTSTPGDEFFRGAPWETRIGNWLSFCGGSSPISIPEVLYSRKCPKDCSGRGVCNHELGECRCFHGYEGSACQEDHIFECNDPATMSKVEPYGRWMVSMCGGYCDKTLSFCFCGEGSKYPDRPLAESCGFVQHLPEVDWTKADGGVYSNDSENIGWCNLSPEDGYAGKYQVKPYCDCKYDCTGGEFCERVIECSCINQCSGRGVCKHGFCKCTEGWYGLDCSLPSANSWPSWLPSKVVNSSSAKDIQDHALRVEVQKLRPLIYVYELPVEFNAHLLQGRHFRYECVNRIYGSINETIWTEQLYGAEIALYESLLASPHRTTNGDEADFFYVPVLGACAITRADDAPHYDMQRNFLGLRGYFSGDFYKRAYEYIRQTYPFWDRSGGRDHMWFFSWDEGACSAPKEIWDSMMLVHWGNTMEKYKSSTTQYPSDNWDPIPASWRGGHPCYDPAKDLVLPAWKVPRPEDIKEKLWARPLEDRHTLFYFNGNLGPEFGGRPEPGYSMGLRQALAREFASEPNRDGEVGRQVAADVVVLSKRVRHYNVDLSRSRFCGVFPGDGWSGRMEDSVLHGCIPVIVQDGIHLPYENVLDYEKFAVRIAEADLPNMVSILRAMNETEVRAKLEAVQGLWQRFTWHYAVKLEAHRQRAGAGYEMEWARVYNELAEADAYATLLQVLHYKLHNDEWREAASGKQFGVPDRCRKQ